MQLQNIVTNLVGQRGVRQDQLEGRDYIVVPMVMLTEGVHAGSNGPLYYPREELSKTPVVWNHKPIVVYHPEMNGVGISACDQNVINTQKVGLIMNTRFDSRAGKLRAEAWLDKERMEKVDARISAVLNEGKMMEVSTGLFTDNEVTPGEHKGKAYDQIARNYRPDHLALLPDRVGACSIADGAGLLQLNEMSFSNIQGALVRALEEKLGSDKDGRTSYPLDVYDGFVVYEFNNKLYKLEYDLGDNNAVKLQGVPEEVQRVTEYRTLTGDFVGNASVPVIKEKENSMAQKTKKDLVAGLIANKSTKWAAADEPWLLSLNEDQLEKLEPVAEEKPKDDPANPAAPGKSVAEVQPAVPAQNAAPVTPAAPVSAEQYVNNAPPEIRNMLAQGLRTHAAERAKMVSTITANKANTFSQQQLEAMDSNMLSGLAALAIMPEPIQNQTNPAIFPSFIGAASPAPTQNNSAPTFEPLIAPVMNFGTK